ncbi:3968_t:CDS:2 [Entrophospora sp. SA101]|nr:12114_t:CDS:2 [Entrophospora sp. SA101]CAJ0839696.1 3968_t:CDS:2 [Entrophospora sp. SA101]
MNYREKQLRQIIKRDYVPKNDYQTLHFQYQQTLNDVDYQLQVHTKKENEEYGELEENLNQQAQAHHEQQTNLKEQSHQEKQLYLAKINDLEQALLNLAKQKLKGKKEAQEFLTQLEQN